MESGKRQKREHKFIFANPMRDAREVASSLR